MKDELIRFLLPDARARGAIIRGEHINQEAADIHGLQGQPTVLFGQTLLASIVLLSVSKGGVRQVLQLDATSTHAPIARMQAETKSGAVRGYVQWQDKVVPAMEGSEISAWMGKDMLLSTVRDLGVGQPYVSSLQHNSDWLAEHIMHYLSQSVQIRADVILQGNLALMIEAMPGCDDDDDDDDWFKAVEALARISNDTLDQCTPEVILECFNDLGCQIVGRDDYQYQCSCSIENMKHVFDGMAKEEIQALADDAGEVILSCQYCKRTTKINASEETSS